MAVKEASRENRAMFAHPGTLLRNAQHESPNVHIVENATGFGLYDRVSVEALRRWTTPIRSFAG